MATILIIDDNAVNREFLVTLLSYAGHCLLDCADGATALEIARAKHPDLIVCDIVMPIMNGIEFVKNLRADPSISQIPVIFYTAAFRSEEIGTLLPLRDIADVITKPSDPEIILKSINKVLGLSTSQPPPPPVPVKQKTRKDGLPTIHSRLLLLVIACIVPAALLAAVLITYNYQHERAQLARDAIMTARALTAVVDRDLASEKSALLALATSPYLTSNNLPAFYNQAKDTLQNQIARNIILLDSTDQQLINTLEPFGTPLPSHGIPTTLHRIFETGRPAITDLFIGPVTHRPLIAIGVPVRRGETIAYTLAIGIWPDRLSTILAQQKLPPTWIASIFDSTGTIVARTHENERFVGHQGSSSLVKRMKEVAEDSFESATLEGIPVLSVFSRSTVSNWTVTIGIPQKEITMALWHSLGWIIFATTILLALSLSLAWKIGGRIAKSFQGLIKPAIALGYGEKVVVPPLDLKEADEVGNALTKTSIKLHLAQYQAQHDALTGLANRMLFSEIVDQQMAISHRTGTPFAILYIDLDGFKSINDQHGHAVGDELLRMAAERLKTEMRDADVAARLGGDEFAAGLVSTDITKATTVAERLIENISRPYNIGALTTKISASIGVAGYSSSANTADLLLQRADEAMYNAKITGKNRIAVAA